MSDAFRIGSADHPAVPRTVRGRLEQRMIELTGQLVHSQDWPDFKQRRGVLLGLQEAIGECEAAEKQHGD